MKSKLLIFAMVLASSAAQAQEVDINPNARLALAVSNTDPNYISVMDDRVIAIQATQGVLSDKRTTAGGAVLFSTVSDKPFTLFVQTESGFAFSVMASPRKQAGLSLVVNNRQVRGTEAAREWEGSQNTYSALVTSLITKFINNDKPSGFVYTKNRDVLLSPSTETYFSVRSVAAWQGDKLRIVRLDVTNRSTSRIELNERYFWSKGVMAVSFWPQVDQVSPGTTVSAIVLLRDGEKPR